MEEVEVLDVAAVRGQAVDEVLQDALGDLAAQLVVVAEDVLHRLCLQQLQSRQSAQTFTGFTLTSSVLDLLLVFVFLVDFCLFFTLSSDILKLINLNYKLQTHLGTSDQQKLLINTDKAQKYPGVEEKVQVLVQQSLVLLVPHAELLQEQVSVPDDLLHLHVVLQRKKKTAFIKAILRCSCS